MNDTVFLDGADVKFTLDACEYAINVPDSLEVRATWDWVATQPVPTHPHLRAQHLETIFHMCDALVAAQTTGREVRLPPRECWLHMRAERRRFRGLLRDKMFECKRQDERREIRERYDMSKDNLDDLLSDDATSLWLAEAMLFVYGADFDALRDDASWDRPSGFAALGRIGAVVVSSFSGAGAGVLGFDLDSAPVAETRFSEAPMSAVWASVHALGNRWTECVGLNDVPLVAKYISVLEARCMELCVRSADSTVYDFPEMRVAMETFDADETRSKVHAEEALFSANYEFAREMRIVFDSMRHEVSLLEWFRAKYTNTNFNMEVQRAHVENFVAFLKTVATGTYKDGDSYRRRLIPMLIQPGERERYARRYASQHADPVAIFDEYRSAELSRLEERIKEARYADTLDSLLTQDRFDVHGVVLAIDILVYFMEASFDDTIDRYSLTSAELRYNLEQLKAQTVPTIVEIWNHYFVFVPSLQIAFEGPDVLKTLVRWVFCMKECENLVSTRNTSMADLLDYVTGAKTYEIKASQFIDLSSGIKALGSNDQKRAPDSVAIIEHRQGSVWMSQEHARRALARRDINPDRF